MRIDPRFLTDDGSEIFTGNELLLKGALETDGGVHLLAGYPGSPIAGFFDAMSTIHGLLTEHGIRAVVNNNEALAAAMLNGSQVAGCRGMIVMKSVGVHVAADALALGAQCGAHPEGGAVIVYGDDPWSDSTQVPADSRYISRHLYIPVIEPSNAQEVKDFIDLAFKVSRQAQVYCGLIMPNNLADGGGSVLCRPNRFPEVNTRQRKVLDSKAIDVNKFVLLPPKTWWQEESMAARHADAVRLARDLALNRIEDPAESRMPIGFATSGLAHGYLRQALWEMGLLGRFPVAKFGMSYPIDRTMVEQMGEMCERIVVVEERRGFLEEQISEVIAKARQASRPAGQAEVWGKQLPGDRPGLPETRGLHPSILISHLAPLIKDVQGQSAPSTGPRETIDLDRELATIDSARRTDVGSVPGRLPSFCPGCPHRDTSSLCLDIKKKFMNPTYMSRYHDRGTVDLVFHGDTGCYTMLMYPPNTDLMHDYSGMGLGGGTGAGMDPFIDNKQAVFMGDSTFFHSGKIAISQAIKLGQDITFIILDNRTTAMTGHQPTPGVDYDIVGDKTVAQNIDEIVRGMAVGTDVPVIRANPEQHKEYRQLLEETFLADGVKVIIADKECGITRTRRQRRQERATTREKGYLPTKEHMNINPEVCRFCLACSEQTGCPGLRHVPTDYGPKMDTDLSACVADGSCERVGACSAFEKVIVKRKRPPKTRVPELGLDDIPEPAKRPIERIWRGCLVGVGGMGIGLATSILVRAGHKEGYPVVFLDKKGLAIRNGGVVSQIVYNPADQPVTAIIPYGKADLLLGVDVLEAARALDPAGRSRIASRDQTAAVINTTKVQTIAGIMGREDFDPDALVEMIRQHTREKDFLAKDISRICEKYLGSRLYSNVMMIGFAFQKGLIPVSMHSMAWAIKDTIRADFRKNLYAFNMGRKLCEDQSLFQGAPQRTGWKDTLEEKCRYTIRRYAAGQKQADQLRELVTRTLDPMGDLDDALKRDIVVRTYDCLRWGGLDYARIYASKVAAVYADDSAEFGHQATQAVIHNLARAMLIKDGVFIAELSTSPEKYARDREKYNINPANGDRALYRHLWNVDLRLFGKRKQLDLTLPDWSLKAFKRMRWLRNALPGWHSWDRKYRETYLKKVDAFAYASMDEYRRQVGRLSASQCMNCMNPRCAETGCPLASRVPDWMQLADQGRWKQAADVLHEDNNFPEFTARICPAFCQESCKKNITDFPVQVQQMEEEIIDRAWKEGWITPQPASARTGKHVAVVGSGPAGLAAAQQLARAGHEVTVFDREDQPGGLLRYGIPGARLDKALIDRRVEQLSGEGVAFRNGVQVGKDVPASELRQQYDAVLLAVGATLPRDLDVPGRSSPGVHFALDYLRQGAALPAPPAGQYLSESAELTARDKVVAVIGGGLTGLDCVETAVQQGAKQVVQLEILPKTAAKSAGGNGHPLPSGPIEQKWCVSTKAFQTNGGNHLSEIRACEVEWEHSPAGPVMKEKPDSEFVVQADLALLAVGFEPKVEKPLAQQLGLADDDGRIRVDRCATDVEGLFAAGDVVTGPAYVATAIDSGRRAAQRICEYLQD